MTFCDGYANGTVFQAIQNRGVEVCVILALSLVVTTVLVGLLLPTCRGLVYLFWLTIACNAFIPIAPHEPVVLLYGKLYSPWVVAVCAAVATSIVELANYRILSSILNVKRIVAFREKRLYQRAERCFSRFPFWSLLLSGLAPIPFIPFRMLAVTTRYSVKRFVLSVFIGRMPRFYLLALTGMALDVPAWVYVMVLALTVGLVLTRKLTEHRRDVVIRGREA